MSRLSGYAFLAAFAAGSTAIVACRPEWASDKNTFLRDFVSHEFLGLLGVILAITLASVASLHFEFNKIEERYQRRELFKSRQNLSKNSYWLIGLFCSAVALVAIKPVAVDGGTSEAIFNMGALLILLWHILILISLTQLAFAIEPDIRDANPPPRSPPEDGQGPRHLG